MSPATTATQQTARRPASIAAASEYAGVHPRTIRRWIAAGWVTAYRMGPRLIRVDMDDIDSLHKRIPAAGGGPGA
ncbi:MAG: excisionase family DNA-binding protein [Nocardioidaceae bacterium]|nr:excisionase family DNA-binding protein [Nocardioidaceae bacterium]